MKTADVDGAAEVRAAAAFRTLPNASKALGTGAQNMASVTADAGDATPVDLRGCFVFIENTTAADIWLLRGLTGMTAPTSGQGKRIPANGGDEFFIKPGAPFIRASATGLTIGFDTDLAKAV